MKLIDLEVLCVKNVARDSNTGFNADSYDDFASNPQYADYINNVDDDINQAIARLVSSEKLPTKSFEHDYTLNKDNRGKYITIDFTALKNEFYNLKKVLFVDPQERYFYPSYTKTSPTTLLVEKANRNGKYIITYTRKIPFLNHDINRDDDLQELYGIDDTVCSLYILNFVKSKLWESEEPSLAQNYMNYAESYLSTYENEEDSLNQEWVDTVCTY